MGGATQFNTTYKIMKDWNKVYFDHSVQLLTHKTTLEEISSLCNKCFAKFISKELKEIVKRNTEVLYPNLNKHFKILGSELINVL